ncbi:PAS domain S-box protein [Halosimplex halophilum]|uniref:PAS domain S-box protein n=1 Tax=Halosimplex halophilum TaxID=2559572 RepID=UPI00107F1629|nr:PAS domain S-box protein [Halosimplex halophilum]
MESHGLTEGLRETLAAFDGGGEPRTTSEVADSLGLGRRSTYDRLDRLVERGYLRTKKVGASARVWWRPADPDPDGAGRGGPDGADTADPDWPAAAESLVADVLGTVDVGVFVLDADYEVRWVNDAVERYFGVDRADLLGRDKGALLDERIAPAVADSAAFADRVRATYDEGVGEQRFECRVTAGDGREERWLEHRSQPIESGAYAGGRVELYVDVTERKRAELSLRDQRDQFESLVDAVEEYAIFRLDTDGHVETWNPGVERLKGYEAEEIVGEHLSTFYTEADREAGVPERNLATAAERGWIEDEGWRVRADGTRFWANVTITAIYDDGDLDGFAKITRDMTERREFERELRRERDLLERVFDAIPVGVAVLDEAGEPVRMNDRTRRYLGIGGSADAESAGGEESTKLPPGTVHDADGEPVPPGERPYERPLRTGEPVRDWVGRFDLPDLGERWLSIDAVPLTDDGAVERVVVSAEDVTQLKEQAERLERRRADLEHELDEVLERIDDGFFALDEDWRFSYVNDRAAALLDRDRHELVGRNVWDAFPEAVGTTFQEHYERARETGESVSFEAYFPPLATWFEVSAHPSESGLSVYFRDVSERKARERELERYERIVETVEDGIYVVDEDGYFTQVNETYAAMVGRDPEELVGSHVSTVVDGEVAAAARRLEDALAVDDRATATLEATLSGPDGEEWVGEATFSLMDADAPADAEDGGHERIAVVRDITERKERERELEQYERIVETVDDGIYALDDDGRFVLVNDAFCEMLGYERDELLGMEPTAIYDEEYAPVVEERAEAVAAGEREAATIEFELHRKDGTAVPVETRYEPFPYGDGLGRCGVVRDISERLDRQRELQRRVRQQAVVTELGRRALEERDLDALMAEAAEEVATTLGNDYCKVLELDDDGAELLLRQGVGWDEGLVGEATVSAVEDDSQASYTLQSGDPVVVEDLRSENRFGGPDLLRDHGVRSGISVVIGSPEEPWGILGTHDTEPASVSRQDVNFVQSVATVLATAINRRRYEERLVSQREQLAALNSLNEVVNGITDAVVDQSTREEIERTVCEHLAAADSYRFAWIGEVDTASQTVDPRAKAGTDGYLEGMTITVDPDDERSGGPTGRAFRTGEMQVTRDIQASDAHDPWRERVDSYGVRSSAAIPIVHEGTTYGVLNVYAGRPDAFEGQERTVLAQLGEVVGHAIAAAERKQALLSDEVVELDFQITDLFEALDLDEQPGGRFSFDHVVSVGDDEFLVYGTVSPEAVDTIEELVEQLPHWADVSFDEAETDGEDARDRGFELRVVEPPVLSTLASLGGSVEEAVFEDGDYRMTLHVSPSTDVRQVIEAVTEAYPQATMLRRQQVATEDAQARPTRSLLEGLTDRQRTTLEAAYHAGFFEWPRDASGEDVAESLQVSPPTFHQHLRKAEGKVFGGLFEGDAD